MSPQNTIPALEAFPPLATSSFPAFSFSISAFAPVIVLLGFLVWLGFSLAVAYHWIRYAHRSWLAVPALSAHVFISGALIIYAISGL